MRKHSFITVTDQFCGAGGSSIGATKAGAELRLALNHWRMPAGAIYVGRPSRWGNHVRIDPAEIEGVTPAEARRLAHKYAVLDYEKSILWNIDADDFKAAAQRELREHDLVCWCRLDEPCHADVLLKIANE